MRALLLWLALAAVLAVTPAAQAAPACFGAASRDPRHACVNHRLDHRVTPAPDDALIEPSEPCRVIRRRGPEVCAFGVRRAKARYRVAMIGDSHARHWDAALAVIAQRRRWQVLSISRSRCAFSRAPKPGHRCAAWVRQVDGWLTRHPTVHLVLASGDVDAAVVAPDGDGHEVKQRGFAAAWDGLPSSVRRLVVLHDVPHATLQTRDCVKAALRRHAKPGEACAHPRDAALHPDDQFAAAEAYDDAALRVDTLDLTPFMCDDEQCFPVVGGALVIKDVGHLTRTFSTTLGRYVGRGLAELGVSAAG